MRGSLSLGVAAAMVATSIGLQAGPAAARSERAVTPTKWNESSDPQALYGSCFSGGGGTQTIRSNLPREVGETLQDVLAITVLECRPFTGGGGAAKVSCPAGSPFAYCVRNSNDGGGNLIKVGVLKTGARTDPYHRHTGCRGGRLPDRRINLLLQAGEDPRLINGIVTLRCRPARGRVRPPRMVACPAGPHPYAYCLGTRNNGRGHSVKVGVVAANGPGDPYGLYGECNAAAFGVQRGFQRKVNIAAATGIPLGKVASIHLSTCREPDSSGPLRTVRPCPPRFLEIVGWKYDHCVEGNDRLRNFVRAGILTRP